MQSGIIVINYICNEESTDFGIVITALEIIEPGLCRAGAAKLGNSYMTHTPQSCIGYGENSLAF